MDYKPIRINNNSPDERYHQIYHQYHTAMSRRRPDSSLEFDRFVYYIQNAGMFNHKNSYVFGQNINGFFIPTHFAPASLKEGVELITELKKYDNIIFVVTSDLIPMLKKLNYKILPHTFKKEFRGNIENKEIAVSSFKHIKNLASLALNYSLGKEIQPTFIPQMEAPTFNPPNITDERELYNFEKDNLEKYGDISPPRRKVKVKRIIPEYNIKPFKQFLLTESHKQKQLNLILKHNPMTDNIHTGIRTINDIKTTEEAFHEYPDGITPDFNQNDMITALKNNSITIYSSKPITIGSFITPSKMEALSYSGVNKIYSKTIPLTHIAWIDASQGQYTPLK